MVSRTSDMDVLSQKHCEYSRRMAESINILQKDTVLKELRHCADICLDDGNLSLAKHYYARAVEFTEQTQSWPYIGLGVIALKLNYLTEAKMAFISAAQCDDDCVEAFCGLGRIHLMHGMFEEATCNYLTALEIAPDNLIAITGLFRLCRQSGEFGEIIKCINSYLKRHPDDKQMMLCLASIYNGKSGKSNLAAVLSERVLELEPENKDAVLILNNVRKDSEYAKSVSEVFSCGCAED